MIPLDRPSSDASSGIINLNLTVWQTQVLWKDQRAIHSEVSSKAEMRRERLQLTTHLGAATDTVTVGHAAFDAAVTNWPGYNFKLRKGALLIREHPNRKRDKSSSM